MPATFQLASALLNTLKSGHVVALPSPPDAVNDMADDFPT
jgi:hypothetical protein